MTNALNALEETNCYEIIENCIFMLNNNRKESRIHHQHLYLPEINLKVRKKKGGWEEKDQNECFQLLTVSMEITTKIKLKETLTNKLWATSKLVQNIPFASGQ